MHHLKGLDKLKPEESMNEPRNVAGSAGSTDEEPDDLNYPCGGS
jgi:hypothetical protein